MGTGPPSFVTAIVPNRRTRRPAPLAADRNCGFCTVLTLATTFGSRPMPILASYPTGDKAMYDVNPLGPMMHLKELDRQAAPQLRPLRPRKQNGFSLTTGKSLMI